MIEWPLDPIGRVRRARSERPGDHALWAVGGEDLSKLFAAAKDANSSPPLTSGQVPPDLPTPLLPDEHEC
jgi:hypothetical protein